MASLNRVKKTGYLLVITYSHKDCHNLKILSNKSGMLCAKVSKCSKQQPQCKKQHRDKFVLYEEGMVYFALYRWVDAAVSDS